MNKTRLSNSVLKKINNRYAGIEEITHDEWLDIEDCVCRGPVLKYHDISTNTYVVKCGHVKETLEFDSKNKKKFWLVSKKKPCGYIRVCTGDKPDYKENVAPVTLSNKNVINPDNLLHSSLDLLFKYYFVSGKDSTIHEINHLVKNKLFRKTRERYSSTNKETMEEYHDRIFSVPIIDKSVMNNITNNLGKLILDEKEKYEFIEDPEDLSDNESKKSDSESESSESESDTEVETEVSELASEDYDSGNESYGNYSD